ncbi:hypothetical protein [Neisseria bergeri]|nr:hypothetical protein [Neisseria bergeri]
MPSEKDGGTKLALPKRKTSKQPHPNTFRRHLHRPNQARAV